MLNNTISLPVSVVSGKAAKPSLSYKTVSETFSTEYIGKLPNNVLLQLGKIFKNTNHKSTTVISTVDEVISLLCKYMIQNEIKLLTEINYGHLCKFMEFIRRETCHKKTWRRLFGTLGFHTSGTVLEHLIWPKVPSCSKGGKTQGHSIFAHEAMGRNLREEIDRIRSKKERLAEARKNGKVLTLADLLFMNGRRYGRSKPGQDNGSWVTQDDVICTILHYLPGWPAINRDGREKWYVYAEPQGIRLATVDTKEEAERMAVEKGAYAIVVPSSNNRKQQNPGERLLFCIKWPRGFCASAAKHLRSLFDNFLEIINTYFPTYYDMICVFLYWTWLTGWNVETMASVTAEQLGFGIDIAKFSPLQFFTADHIEITGKPPTVNRPKKIMGTHIDASETSNAGCVITGHKTRSQPGKEPKPYTHISDKNDPYSLYCVLKDYYELTEPLRPYLKGSEKSCILVGVVRANLRRNLNLTMFGGPLHGDAPDYDKKGVGQFFAKNPIFEDNFEFSGNANREPHVTVPDISAEPDRFSRVWLTTASKMRTTYESWLQKCGIPIYERQVIMGHESANTTMTEYGAESVSVGMRIRALRSTLNEVEKKALQGQLQRYNHKPRTINKNNIVQVFSHLQSDVFICQNPNEPTWVGHEEYVEGKCTAFDECLFCKQCLITPDSLPMLIRWQKVIKNEMKLVGPVGIGDKALLVRRAIEEVFDLCRNGGGEWQAALEKAYEIEIDPDFTAPDPMYSFAAQRRT